MERKHGARVWLTKQQLTKKYGCPQVAQQIVDAKMSDAELFESQTKPHPDAPQSEAGLECHWPCLPVFWGCSFMFHMQLVMCVRVCVCALQTHEYVFILGCILASFLQSEDTIAYFPIHRSKKHCTEYILLITPQNCLSFTKSNLMVLPCDNSC